MRRTAQGGHHSVGRSGKPDYCDFIENDFREAASQFLNTGGKSAEQSVSITIFGREIGTPELVSF